MMNRNKIARELLHLAKQLVAAVRKGEVYELDLKKALSAHWATPQWKRLVKALHRRGDGYVKVDSVERNRGVAEVYEAHVSAPILGTVQVPLDALVGSPVRASEKHAKIIQRIPNLSIESDAVVLLLDMLESNHSAAKKIYSKAWDALAGGGKKKAQTVLTPLTTKFVEQNWDEFVEQFSEMHSFDFNDARSRKMVGKVMAAGLLNDMVDMPMKYAKYLSPQAKKEMEEAITERGKQKLETMLKNKGLVSSKVAADEREIRRATDCFVDFLQKKMDKHFADEYPNQGQNVYTSDGRRYIRIFTVPTLDGQEGRGKSVFAFVDKETGDILKPASWRKPAKHARGNVLDMSSWKKMGPYSVPSLR